MLRGIAKRQMYLDWASAAPISSIARKAFDKALDSYANPSSPHAMGAEARVILDEARKDIARLATVKTDGVIFTSGATEANALAIRGHVRARMVKGARLQDMHLLYLPTAHSSVVETIQSLADEGAQVEALVLRDGVVDLMSLKKQLRPETVLVSADVVCGETGTKYITRDVRRVIDAHHSEQAPSEHSSQRVLLHVDASQAPLVESINHMHLGADLMTLDAQKVGGIRGIGALVRASATQAVLPLAAIMQGGGQEYGLRPGTENPALAAAFAAALMEAERNREEFVRCASEARADILKALSKAFPEESEKTSFVVNESKEFSPHILNLSFMGRDMDFAVMLLSKAGFAVSTKSACETDAVGSRVVLELLNSYGSSISADSANANEARALSTLRISWGPSIKVSELQKFAKELIRTVQFLDAHSL